MALSPTEMDAAVIRNLADKTGRTLKQWQAILEAAGPFAKPAAAATWLKSAHSLGHVTAQIVVGILRRRCRDRRSWCNPSKDCTCGAPIRFPSVRPSPSFRPSALPADCVIGRPRVTTCDRYISRYAAFRDYNQKGRRALRRPIDRFKPSAVARRYARDNRTRSEPSNRYSLRFRGRS